MKKELPQVLLTGDAHCDALRRVVTESALKAQQARNAQRAQEAIKALGAHYSCHPANRVPRKAPEPDRAAMPSVVQMLRQFAAI